MIVLTWTTIVVFILIGLLCPDLIATLLIVIIVVLIVSPNIETYLNQRQDQQRLSFPTAIRNCYLDTQEKCHNQYNSYDNCHRQSLRQCYKEILPYVIDQPYFP